MRLLFFEISIRGLARADCVVLSQHVTRCSPWSGFPYYNLTTSNLERSPLNP